MTNANIKHMVQKFPASRISEETKVREVLQTAALLGLARHGLFERAAFYGGTALRILYGLDRFSEDLDFTLLQPDPKFDFAPFLEGMRAELNSFGFEMEVSQKSKNVETSILSAFMKMNTIKLYLAIGDEQKSKTIPHNEKTQIKIEIDIDPPGDSRPEFRPLSTPVPFQVLTLDRRDLFAGKMHAMLYRAWRGRVKGRDWFDFIWYLQNKIPLSLRYLEACMKQAGNLKPDESLSRERVIEMLRTKIQGLDWESAKADIRIFVANPKVIENWSPELFLGLLDYLTVEEK
jgi:hypothetical protein